MDDNTRFDILSVRIDALEKMLDERVRSIKETTAQVSSELDKRLGGMNEFRRTIQDQANHYLTKDVYDAQQLGLQDQIRVYSGRINAVEQQLIAINAASLARETAKQEAEAHRATTSQSSYHTVATAGVVFSGIVWVITILWNVFQPHLH